MRRKIRCEINEPPKCFGAGVGSTRRFPELPPEFMKFLERFVLSVNNKLFRLQIL
jgi:hypothetical protein